MARASSVLYCQSPLDTVSFGTALSWFRTYSATPITTKRNENHLSAWVRLGSAVAKSAILPPAVCRARTVARDSIARRRRFRTSHHHRSAEAAGKPGEWTARGVGGVEHGRIRGGPLRRAPSRSGKAGAVGAGLSLSQALARQI